MINDPKPLNALEKAFVSEAEWLRAGFYIFG